MDQPRVCGASPRSSTANWAGRPYTHQLRAGAFARVVVGACIVPLAAGCGGDNSVLPGESAPQHVTIERGNDQTGPAGATLLDSLVVRVTDGLDRPVVGMAVAFTALNGGRVDPDTAQTDSDGRAAARWTLGQTAGAQQAEARTMTGAPGDSVAAVFRATATGAPGTGGRTATTTSIVSHTPDPSDQGRGVVITVAVTSAGGTTPPGMFMVTASTGETCQGFTDERRAECNFSAPGERTLVATYPGDAQYAPSSSAPVTQTVNAVAGATRTIIGIGPDSAHVGQPLKIFVHVRGAGSVPASGIVNFYEGRNTQCGQGNFLGGVELNASGDGTLPVSFSAPGFYVVRGCYTGAPGLAPSEDLASETILP
jgi:hypothetical protein